MKEFNLNRNYDVHTKIQIVKRTNGRYYAEIVRNIDDIWNENDEYECWIDEPSNIMTEENLTEQEYDAIIETFCSYIKENGIKYARKCTCCDKGMNDGYVAIDEYFCSDSCLRTEYTAKEWEELSSDEENNDSCYWTEWETEEDFEYVLFDNKLITI